MNKFKEIIEMKKQKSASRKPRYGTRKLSIGLVSCVLGYAMLVSPSVALADEANEQPIAEETANPEVTANTKEKPEAKEETKPAENSQANDEETNQAAVEEKKVENSEKETATPAQDSEETEKPVAEKETEEKEEASNIRLTIDQYNALQENKEAEETADEETQEDEASALDVAPEEIPEAQKEGENTEDAITNVEIKIGGAVNGDNTEIVNPTALPERINGGNTDINLEAQVDFDIPEGTKSGKTFDFVVSDNVNLHGVLESETEGQPVVFDGEEIATAEKLTDGRNGYKYTFNEKVDGLKDIRVRIIYPLFIDPNKVPMGTKEYKIGEDGKYVLDEDGNPVLKADNKEKVSVTVAGKTESKDYTVEYESEVFDIKTTGPTLSGIADIDNVTDNNYNHTIYVNPTADQMLNRSHVTVQNEKGYNTITFDDEVKNSVKVYKVKDPNKLPLSFGNDFNDGNYEDVTSKANVKLVKDGNNADLNKLVVDVNQGNTNQSQPFDDKDFDKSTYVITYTGKRTPYKAFKTNTIFTADWRKANGNVKNLSKLGDQSWAWTNEIVIDDADAIALANKTYSLGDRVWIDADEDGSQGDTEKGLEGVKVILKGINMSDRETTTDAQGNYKFDGLKNGEYTVEFEIPSGYAPTTANKDGVTDEKNSDASKDATNNKKAIATGIINGANNMNVDFGVVKSDDPAPEDQTYTLGDRVWVDDNKDGLQTEGEKGVKGVTVKLTGGDLTEEKTTTTDKDGKYKFTGLKNGEYKVTFEIPEGYEATKSNEGDDDAKDSDGATVNVTINNANNDTIDLGLVKKETPAPEDKTYTLGDKVWIDTDKNGIQGDEEEGKSGVTVKLTGGDLTEEKTTTTDKDGKYEFTGLKNGDYKVTFEIPEGYEATKSNQGDDDAKDSDGTSVTVTINNANNDTIDLGLVKKETPGKPSEPTTPTPSKPNDDKPVVPNTPNDPEEPTPLIPLTPADPIEEEPGKVIENEDKPVVETEEKDKTVEDKDEEKTVENTEEASEKVKNSVEESIKVPRQKISSNPKTGVASSLGVMGTLAASALAFLGLDDKKRKNK